MRVPVALASVHRCCRRPLPVLPAMSRAYDAFISYTRQQGGPVAARLLDRLRQEQFRVWQDATHMRGGEAFWAQIETAITRARFLLMVLSPDAFVGERAVLRNEWLTARRRGCHVLPVYASGTSPIDFASPAVPAWLTQLDCYDLDRPNDADRLLNDLRSTPSIRPVPHNVEFPAHFVRRERELRELVAQLGTTDGARVAITAALQGAGGFGKTTLARAVCFEDEVLARYTDGVLWLTVGQAERSQADLLGALLVQLGESPRAADPAGLVGAWKEALRTRRCLVVLDDVWREIDAEGVVVRETPSAFLLTTRAPRVATAVDASDCRVGAMEASQAVAMLAAALPPGDDVQDVGDALRALAERAGHWPVLLGLIAGQLRHLVRRQGASAAQALALVVEDLKDLGLEAFDRRNSTERATAVRATMEASLRYVEQSEAGARARYLELATFPQDVPLPLAVLAELWGVSAPRARRLAERFDDAGLAELDHARGLGLHDVYLAYLMSQGSAADRVLLHQRLLATWSDSHALPHAYAWRWFGWHCVEAGDADRLGTVLLELPWLERKLAETDAAALLADCARAEGRTHALLAEAVEKSVHVLAVDPEQLAAQVFGRLRRGVTAPLDAFIEQAHQKIAQKPIWPQTPHLLPVGSPLRRTMQHLGVVLGVRLLLDGRFLSWGSDATLRLWAADGAPVGVLRGHDGPVDGAVALADGRLLSWGTDATLRLWAADGSPLRALRGHDGPVDGAVALADGRLLSWGADATLRLWAADGSHKGVLHLDASATVAIETQRRVWVGDGLGGIHLLGLTHIMSNGNPHP